MPDLGPWLLAIGPLALIALVARFYRKTWPKWRNFFRKLDAGLTSVIGHGEIRDPGNPARVLAQPRPGLGEWMAGTDDTLAILSTAVTALADQGARQDGIERRVEHIESKVAQLELAALERIANRTDSTAMFDAMKAASESTPPDHDD